MRFLIASLGALSLMATNAPAQSLSTNPLDQPARSSDGRLGVAPAVSGTVRQATSSRIVGTEPWVLVTRLEKADPSSGQAGKPIQSVCLYQLEKNSQTLLTPGRLNQANNSNASPRSSAPWYVAHVSVPTLTGFLRKFTEWSDVAEKNNVLEVQKEIGLLHGVIENDNGQLLFFRREKQLPKNWLLVTAYGEHSKLKYKLSSTDVSAILELLGRLPELDAQISGNTAPNKATDSLFK